MNLNQTLKVHRGDIDLLKGLAILAVALFHMHICPSGYLGVDVFFVINGFLIVPSVVKNVANGQFRFFGFLEKRIMRLLPLLLLVSALSLVVGYMGMLPDEYENLSQSVLATNLFSNNILSSIVTKNYWIVANDYKPLMHTWYIGILFEFYIVFPVIVMMVKWLSDKLHFSFYKYVVISILSLSVISFLLYLLPSVSIGDRFYLMYYRFFELAFGGLAGMWIFNHRQGILYNNGLVSAVGVTIIVLIMFAGIQYVGTENIEYDIVQGKIIEGESFIPQNVLLLLSVILTILYVVSDNMHSKVLTSLVKMKVFCWLGVMSYSIFIWHQPLLAFYRYYFTDKLDFPFIIIFTCLVLLLSFVTYRFVEQKVKIGRQTRIAALVAFVLINGFAFWIYNRAGVVRDVPELDVYTDNVHRKMHADYVDRIFNYSKDFPDKNGKLNVLIIGNSFGRDLGNILLESEMRNKINLSYIRHLSEKHVSCIKEADYVFIFGWKHEVPYYVWENLKPSTLVYGYGSKNFGESNGIIYKNRNKPDYFQQVIKINPNHFVINEKLKKEWGDNYIDLLALSSADEDGSVIAFSEDHKLMSQDTHHLTRG